MMSPVTRFHTEQHTASEWWGPSALVLVEVFTDAGITGIRDLAVGLLHCLLT